MIEGRAQENEVKYMRRCLELARCGWLGAPPNPMVGAVIVCDGRIIGEGFHQRCGGPHAEVNAIGSVRQPDLLCKSTMYVSLEPCAHYGKTPPCADLIIEKRIPRVVVGCRDTFSKVNGQGIAHMQAAGIEVVVGVLEEECRQLNRRFFTYHEKQRPWVTLKWAQTSDGFIDAKRTGGQPLRISTSFTQALAHRLRASHQAILVGTHTAILDNPSLTTRYWPGPNPLRLTIDRYGVLPDSLQLKDQSVATHIYSTGNLREILADLYERGIQSLLVEGGRALLQSFIDKGLWDEARVETAPFKLGDGVESPVLGPARQVDSQVLDGHQIDRFEPL